MFQKIKLKIKSKFLIILFLFAFASGLFWNQKMFGQPIGSDQVLYDSVAQNLLSGKGFVYNGQEEASIEPLYPLFLAGIYGVFGHNYDAVRIIQIVLFALTVVLTYLLAEKIFNEKIAVWSSLAVALFYGLANQAGGILTESLFIFLILIFIWAIYKAFSENNNFWFFAGVVLGLAALTRGIVQFLPIFIIANIFIFYYGKLPIKKIILTAGIFIAGFLLVVIPWVARNRLINIGAAIAPRSGVVLMARAEWMELLYPDYPAHFIGHLFGYYFAQKINPLVSSSVFRDDANVLKRYNKLVDEGKNEVEIDGILFAEAKNKILAAPHKYVLMSLLDFVSLNSPIIPRGSLWQDTLTIHPMFAEGRHPNIPEWAKVAIILGIRFVWFTFLFLVIYGLVKNLKKWEKIGWIFLIIIYFNLAYSALHAIPRYALPIYPFYIILAIVGLNIFYGKNKE